MHDQNLPAAVAEDPAGGWLRLPVTILGTYRTGLAVGLIFHGGIMIVVASVIGSVAAWGLAVLTLVGFLFALRAANADRATATATSPPKPSDRPTDAGGIDWAYMAGTYPITLGLAGMVLAVTTAPVSWNVLLLVLLDAVAVMGVVTEWSSGRLYASVLQVAAIGGAIAYGLLLHDKGMISIVIAIGVLAYVLLCINSALSRKRSDTALAQALGMSDRLSVEKRTEADRLATAMRFMSHGVMLTDAEGRVVLVNDRFRTMLDLPEPRFPVGSPWEAMIRLSPRIASKTSDGRRAILERTGAMLSSGGDVSTVLQLDDGGILDVDIATIEGRGRLIVLRDVTGETAARDALEREARRCSLTGLANRRAFEEVLSQRLGSPAPATTTVLVLGDLKAFKTINDTYGHPTGDLVLVQVAAWLQAALPNIFVSRLGGDEFAVIADIAPTGTPGEADAADVAEIWARRVHAALHGAADIDGVRIEVEGRVGYACAPDDADTIIDLLRRADFALMTARRNSGGIVRFAPAQEKLAAEQLRQERAVARVLAASDVDVAYQPWFRLDDGKARGVEALARWPVVPGEERLSAQRLVGLAEASGRISLLREQVMQRAMREIGSRDDRLDLAVNISVLELSQPDFAARLLECAAAADFDIRRLHLEITESAIHRNYGQSAGHMHALRAAGVRVSVDDFGSGFSSLAALQALPVDRLKLDKSLLALDERGQPSVVLAAATSIGRGLGLEVVAEGVETPAQLRTTIDLGIDAVQGFLLAWPVPIERLDIIIREGSEQLRRLMPPAKRTPLLRERAARSQTA